MNIKGRLGAVTLMLALAATASAEDRFSTIADWTLQIGPDTQQSFTASNTGASFGVWCYLKSRACLAFLRTPNQCEDGAQTPMLLNASTGAALLSATCLKLVSNGQTIFVNRISDQQFDIAVRGAEAGGEFGFALPLQNGLFVVYRFSGRGATDAITAARTPPASAAPAKAGGDQVL